MQIEISKNIINFKLIELKFETYLRLNNILLTQNKNKLKSIKSAINTNNEIQIKNSQID